MWVCAYCETQNEDSSLYCRCCGKQKKSVEPKKRKISLKVRSRSANQSGENTGGDRRSNAVKVLAILVAVLILILFICYSTIHIWSPATCTEPETCTICGKTRSPAAGHKWIPATCSDPETCSVCGTTRGAKLNHDWAPASCTQPQICRNCGKTQGKALGHKWKAATCTQPETCSVCGASRGAALGHKWNAATCTQPETCSVCGASRGSALGHSWKDATYDAPKTCTRCGLTTGTVKGYLGSLKGTWSEEYYYYNHQIGMHSIVLDEAVYDCIKLTMCFKMYDISGDPYGDWYLYAKNLNGQWSHIASFSLTKDDVNKELRFTFEFSPSQSFTELNIHKKTDEYFFFTYYLYFEDAQHYVK